MNQSVEGITYPFEIIVPGTGFLLRINQLLGTECFVSILTMLLAVNIFLTPMKYEEGSTMTNAI